jgi:hypothetical protein
MRARAVLFTVLSVPAIAALSATAFAGCGDDEATAPPGFDASSDGNPANDDGGGGGTDSGPPTEKSSCVTYITAFCEKSTSCNPSIKKEACQQSAELCPEYFFSEGSTRTIASMLECAAEFAKISCTDWNAGLRPSCQTPGTLAAGSVCISPAQCASSNCDNLVIGTRCGRCSALYGADEECTDTGTFGPKVCPPNQQCDQTTKRCAPIVAPTVLAAGAPCTSNSSTELCPTGTDCYTSSTDAGTGTCQAPPSPGNPCVHRPGITGVVCAPDGYCQLDTASSGTCIAKAKVDQPCGFNGSYSIECETNLYCKNDTCAAFEALGAPCDRFDSCGPTNYCDRAAAMPTCKPPAANGAICGIVDEADGGGTFYVPCASKDCRVGTTAGTTTCQSAPTLGRGADCSGNPGGCYSVLACVNGTCTGLDQAACIADAGDGG